MTSAPPLQTGWEPDTPVTDTVLRQFVFNLAASSEIPVVLMGGRCLHHDDLAATDVGRPSGFFNSATLLQPLLAGRLDKVMRTLDRFYGESGTGEVLLWSAWPTPDLRPHGWELEGHPPMMVRPAGGQLPPLPHGLEIEPVRDTRTLRACEETVIRGYPMPQLQPVRPGALFDERLLSDDRVRLWLGRSDGRPVAACLAVLDNGLNGISLVATVPEARRRGFGEALTWQGTMADPTLHAALLASDLGRPIYERMGFLPITRFTLWRRPRP